MEEIMKEAARLAEDGVKELIVVAQDTSRYGTDLPGHQRLLPELLRQLCAIEELHWVRIHYVYPDEIDDELIDVIAKEPKIVKYLDLPIQHCNDKILKLMNRRGDGAFLRDLFAKLRSRIPGLVIRTSIITGLPGEGEEEFEELCAFLREQKLPRVGAFAFSPEEGTEAAKMEFVDHEVAVRRAELLEMIQSEIMDEYNASMIGKTLEVLVEAYDEENEQYCWKNKGTFQVQGTEHNTENDGTDTTSMTIGFTSVYPIANFTHGGKNGTGGKSKGVRIKKNDNVMTEEAFFAKVQTVDDVYAAAQM